MVALLIFLIGVSGHASNDVGVVTFVNNLTVMRESLALSLKDHKGEITEADFKRVCAPVGMQLKEWAERNKFTARQISKKYRNEQHKPSSAEVKIIERFEKESQLQHVSVPGVMDGRKGNTVYARIPVAEGCLHCHGEKSKRPPFIAKKYPNDRAYGFKVGDLRGLYSVFVPD